MSIVTFWNNSREQTGKTLSAVAVATTMSIERNSKILLISTSVADPTMKNCFFTDETSKKSTIFGTKTNSIETESGLEGLFKLLTSKKITPSIITDYTKVIFKGRLEILPGLTGVKSATLEENIEYSRKMYECYEELITIANQYYDMVIVDLDKSLPIKIKESILKISDVNVLVFSQRLESIKEYNNLKNNNENLIKNKCIPVIGKYISKYKYNVKNIARYLKEKKEFDVVPLNLLYMEAAEEANVADLLLRLRNIKDKTDENYIFKESVSKLANNIVKKLQEMQMKMR